MRNIIHQRINKLGANFFYKKKLRIISAFIYVMSKMTKNKIGLIINLVSIWCPRTRHVHELDTIRRKVVGQCGSEYVTLSTSDMYI